MATVIKHFDQPDTSRAPDKTQIAILTFGDTEVGRFTFQPGWKWSECIKPVVATDRCEVDHVGFLQSGRMTVEDRDGKSTEISAGDAYRIPPGHDGWNSGDEPIVALEFKSAAGYGQA